MLDLNLKLLYSNQQIQQRIADLGNKISEDYKDKPIIAVGLLKGCAVFFAHLLVHIKAEVQIDFMTISSYKHGTKSEDFKFIQDLDTEIRGKHVLIIEDIIDSGKTIKFVTEHLRRQGAASIETAVFVYKNCNLQFEISKPKYFAFEYCQSEFLVGFGFDHQGKFRNLPDVWYISNGNQTLESH